MKILDLTRSLFIVILGFVILFVISGHPVQAQTLDQIKKSGSLRLGYRDDARPFSYRDESGNAAGYSVALCQEIADTIKSELGLVELGIEEVLVSSSDRFYALQKGQIDVLCGAATVTLSRRENVTFSLPIYLSGMAATLRTDAPPRLRALLLGEEPEFRPRWRASYGQILKQRIISVLAGTTAEDWLSDAIEDFEIITELVPVNNYEEGIERVLARHSDVLFGDRAILSDIVARHSATDDMEVLSRQFTHEAIALALQHGDDKFRLLIDRTLSQLYRSGEIIDIYKPNFGELDEIATGLFARAALPE